MDALTPVVTGVLLAVFTVVLTWLGKGRFDRLEREMASLKAEMLAMRSEFRQENAAVRSDLTAVRSDLTMVALAVGAQPRPQTG